MNEGNRLHLYIKSKQCTSILGRNDIKCYNAWVIDTSLNLVSSTTYELSEEDVKIKQILEKYANRYNVEIVINDLAHKDEMRKAKLDGIQSTPSIVMGKIKITNVPSDEASLLQLLGVSEEEIKKLITKSPNKGDSICKECGSHELKIYSDGSGYCLKCNKTFQTLTPI